MVVVDERKSNKNIIKENPIYCTLSQFNMNYHVTHQWTIHTAQYYINSFNKIQPRNIEQIGERAHIIPLSIAQILFSWKQKYTFKHHHTTCIVSHISTNVYK